MVSGHIVACVAMAIECLSGVRVIDFTSYLLLYSYLCRNTFILSIHMLSLGL